MYSYFFNLIFILFSKLDVTNDRKKNLVMTILGGGKNSKFVPIKTRLAKNFVGMKYNNVP